MGEKEVEIPEEYEVPEPEGFENLQESQQNEVIEKRNALMDVMKKYRLNFPKISERQRHELVSMGKYLLRDVPLFKYELWVYLTMIFAMAFIYFMKVEMGLSIIVIAFVPFVLWIVKKFFYMPNKFKLPWIHCYGSRVISLSTADPRKGYIEIGSRGNKKRVYLTKLNKHLEESTGLPCIITTDFQGENISILKDDKPDMRSQEFNAILESLKAVTTKTVMARMLRFATVGKTNPLVILAIIQMMMLGAILLVELGIVG